MEENKKAKKIQRPKETDIRAEVFLSKHSNHVLRDFLKVFLVPVLINKMFMMYFGLNYSNYPGEGYGYGLVCTFLFLLFSVGSFIWKYRHHDDP
jgi:hypothetical protein